MNGSIKKLNYSIQDMFITDKPEITFFKNSFKQYTNFCRNSFEIPFNNINFNSSSSIIVPKFGDLIYSMYLKITIPSINVNENISIDQNQLNNITTILSNYSILYESFKSFVKINFTLLNLLSVEINTIGSNWTTIQNLISLNTPIFLKQLNSLNVPYNNFFTLFNSSYPSNTFPSTNLLIDSIKSFITSTISYYNKIDLLFINNIKLYNKQIYNITHPNYFAWTEKLGFYIIKKLSISIGQNEISNFDSDYLNIFYQLNNKFFLNDTLNNMIGNIKELSDYDNIPKNSYTLYIPIPSWFSHESFTSLPVISLIDQDVELFLHLNDFDFCSFSSNVSNNYNIVDCSLLVDYISLDVWEREKFIIYKHEYLIQYLKNINSISTSLLGSIDLNFTHQIKELFWFFKEQTLTNKYILHSLFHSLFIFDIFDIHPTTIGEYSISNPLYITVSFISTVDQFYHANDYIYLRYTKFYDGLYKIIYSNNNYFVIMLDSIVQYNNADSFKGIVFKHSFNPINNQEIAFNGLNIFPTVDNSFNNYVVPYKYYNNSLNVGLYCYSFSIKPNNYQPSGSSNFSELKSKILSYSLNDIFHNYLISNNLSYSINIYANHYNILRIVNGKSHLTFS